MAPPKHLEPFLDGTPLAVERLKQAWPGLASADRASLLALLLADASKEPIALLWGHHRHCLIDLALADDNVYIRYLAAKNVSAPFKAEEANEEQARFEKVQSDPVPLVRSAYEEERWKMWNRELNDPETFWKRPQPERLALVNGVEEYGEEVAALLRYAAQTLLPLQAVTLDEMLDVLLQYLSGPTMAARNAAAADYARHSGDGYAMYTAGQSVRALWEVLPDLPKDLSYALLDCLPEQAGFESAIPPQVVASLDEHQLAYLLRRHDVMLKALRRQL